MARKKVAAKAGPAAEVNETERKATETVEAATKPEIKKERRNARPYLDLAIDALEKGLYTRKELISAIMTAYPQCSKGGVETFATDLKNVKYCYFRERSVVMQADGKLIFADVVSAKQAAEAEAGTAQTEEKTGTDANVE